MAIFESEKYREGEILACSSLGLDPLSTLSQILSVPSKYAEFR